MADSKPEGIEIQSAAAPVETGETGNAIDTTHTEHAHLPHGHADELDVVPIEEEAVRNAVHINLSWRSWLVVFITCFA